MRTLRPWLVGLMMSAPACAPGMRPEAPAPSPRPVAAQPAKPAPRKAPAKPPAKGPARVGRVDSTALELAVTTRKAHLPLARALAKRTRNPRKAYLAGIQVAQSKTRDGPPSMEVHTVLVSPGSPDHAIAGKAVRVCTRPLGGEIISA